MQALFVTDIGFPEEKSIGKLELRQAEDPTVGDEDILIRVAYASICGSDGHLLRGALGPRTEQLRKRLPMRIGHEMSGIVEKAGKTAEQCGFKPGDHVTGNFMEYCGSCHYCRSGKENFCTNPRPHMNAMAETISWHMSQVFKVPETLDLRIAALTEPVSVAFNAVETAKVKLGSTLAIFGGGGIGLIAVQLAKLAGAAKIVLIEPVAAKRAKALAHGADFVIDPVSEDVMQKTAELTGGLGFDSVIEASGASQAAKSALEILGKDGNVVYFSMYNPTFELPLNLFNHCYFQQKHIHGMWNSVDLFPRVIAMLHRLDLADLIQQEYSLKRYEQAFSDALSGQYPKVILRCND